MTLRKPFHNSAHPPAGHGIGHAVIFSGASGSGKSTILNQLITGTVPDALADVVPPGIADWPLYHGGLFKEWLPGVLASILLGKGVPGLVIHYDLTRFRRLGLDDPVLGLVRFAREMTVVVLRPTDDWLIAQYERRGPPRANEIDRQSMATDPRLAKYKEPGWIDALYRDWHAAIETLSADARVRVVEIEPAPAANGASWRLCL